MRSLVLAVAVAIVAAGAGDYYSGVKVGDKVVRIFADNEEKLSEDVAAKIRDVLGEVDDWGTAQDGGMEFLVRADQLENFSFVEGHLKTVDVTEFHNQHFAWFKEHYEEQVCTDDAETCQADFYTRYQRLDAIITRFTQLASRFSTIRAFDWGGTFQNNRQRGAVISGAGSNKPVVFYFCGEHAREWIPPMFCTYMLETLAEGYQNGDSTARFLLDTFDFYILPVMNPDGYIHTHNGANMWRKSRRPNQGSGCIGTDLNRNYRHQWNTGGSSNDPCSETYHGGVGQPPQRGPFNNPETRNLEDWMNGAIGSRTVVQTDVHAYGQMWMHPWGYTRNLPNAGDNAAMTRNGQAAANAIRSVNGLNFRMGSIARIIYVASGSSCDHFYGAHGVVQAWAPEVRGNSFQPPASNIAPSNRELWAGMVAQVRDVAIMSNFTTYSN